MFEDAVADELIASNPCAIKPEELPAKIDKHPTWRSGPVFTRDCRFARTVLPVYPGQYRLLPTRSNGVAAVAAYRQTDVGVQHRAAAIMLVFVQHGRIAQLVRFAAPTLFPSSACPSSSAERRSWQRTPVLPLDALSPPRCCRLRRPRAGPMPAGRTSFDASCQRRPSSSRDSSPS